MLPNVGYVPWKHEQKVWELHISHWTGETAQLEAYTDWVYGGRFHEVFGRATYRGQPIYGFRTTASGKPLDTFGRLVFLDTLRLRLRAGLAARELVRRPQPERDVLLRLLSVLDRTGAIRISDRRSSPATGEKYRLTLSGPGVTPDVAPTVEGLPDYDARNPTLFELETR